MSQAVCRRRQRALQLLAKHSELRRQSSGCARHETARYVIESHDLRPLLADRENMNFARINGLRYQCGVQGFGPQ